MKITYTKLLAIGLGCSFSLAGCSSIPARQEAISVELVNESPSSSCKFLGEIVGSQGNWITGDYTSNKNLMIGARNDLRNKAYELGGDLVYIQDVKNASAWGSLGTSNTTMIGKAYKCKN